MRRLGLARVLVKTGDRRVVMKAAALRVCGEVERVRSQRPSSRCSAKGIQATAITLAPLHTAQLQLVDVVVGPCD